MHIDHGGDGFDADDLDGPSTVDDLEGQLSKLQEAMDQIQSGDLDGAEDSIVVLENSTRAVSEEE